MVSQTTKNAATRQTNPARPNRRRIGFTRSSLPKADGLGEHYRVDVDVDYLARMLTLIAEYGWAIQGVFPVEEGDTSFAYTVGLSVRARPEIIVRGLHHNVAQSILNTAAARAVKEPFRLGPRYRNILESHPVRFIESDVDELVVARDLYDEVSAIQMLWPDRRGFFPDDTRCDPTIARVQLGP